MNNKKGFTLIELLAVVTIMGILMLVAIPAIARTIENTRRDTFNDTAKKYINAIRNSIISDQLSCEDTQVSATLAGNYYFVISTDEFPDDSLVKQNTEDLLEAGGKSSWGKNDVVGAVVWNKRANNAQDGFKITYYVLLVDRGNHGISTLTEEGKLTRASVLTNTNSSARFDELLVEPSDFLTKLVARKGETTIAASGENKPVKCVLQ